MPAPGRNDPCPCGSGKKYKKCCLARDEAAASAQRDQAAATKTAAKTTSWVIAEDDDLDQLSNRVVDLIHEGRLDEAEKARDELAARYPDMHDCIERTAMIHQARGNLPAAIEWWNKTIDYMQRNEGFEEDGIQAVRDIVAKIERQIAAATTAP
jgi:tetratricopeptide (TPR) repeat protein